MSEKAPEPPTRLVYRVPIRYTDAWILMIACMACFVGAVFFGDISPQLVIAVILGIVVIGLGIVLRSRHVIIDAAERDVITCNAAFLCFLRHWDRIPFEDLKAVKIDVVYEHTATQGRGILHARVCLAVRDRRDLVLAQYPARDDALSEAEKVAKFIGIGLLDMTTSAATVRPPEEVGLSVRDRARLAGAAGVSDLPRNTRLKMETSPEAIRITIPKPRLPWWRYAAVSGGLGLLALVCLVTMFKEAHDTAWVIPIVTLPVLALLFAVVVLPAIRLGTMTTTLEVSPSGLHVHEKAFLRDRTTVIAADDLAELEVVGEPASGGHAGAKAVMATEQADERWLRDFGLEIWSGGAALLARSSSGKLTFGQGLSNEELDWLKAVIEQVLAAGANGRGEGTENRAAKLEGENGTDNGGL